MSTEDKLMKQLWKQERLERWDLYRQFRTAADDYSQRVVGSAGRLIYHPHFDDTGLGSTIVADNTDLGHESYVYLSIFTQTPDDEGNSVRELRSFSVGRVHYALRWRFVTQALRDGVEPIADDASRQIYEGPTSRFGRRLLFGNRRTIELWQNKLMAYHSFKPETDWHPNLGEQIEVRDILKQAIGEISMIGYGGSALPPDDEVLRRHRHSV